MSTKIKTLSNGSVWKVKYNIIEDKLNYKLKCECGGWIVLSSEIGESMKSGLKLDGWTAFRCDKCCKVE